LGFIASMGGDFLSRKCLCRLAGNLEFDGTQNITPAAQLAGPPWNWAESPPVAPIKLIPEILQSALKL
jgi:hypothetical protein